MTRWKRFFVVSFVCTVLPALRSLPVSFYCILGTSYGTVPAILGQITLVHKIAAPGQIVTNRYGFPGISWNVTGNFRNQPVFWCVGKSNCTTSNRFFVHISRNRSNMIDFLNKMCHTIATGNVPDTVPDNPTESAGTRYDDQGHCPHQRLFC